MIDLNIFKNNKFVAKVDRWSFGVTSTHLLKCNIRSVLCLTNFPLHPQIEVLRIPPWFFRFPTQHSDIGQASYQRPFFFFAFTCQHHNHLYPNISSYILHSVLCAFVMAPTKGNLVNNQELIKVTIIFLIYGRNEWFSGHALFAN